jgi:hypothetical protein
VVIVDWNSGKIERRIALSEVTAAANPSWSPDGARLALSGRRGGISDLYLLDLETTELRQLTNDRYADLQPAWSPDGRTLAFTTDRGPGGTDLEALSYGKMRLGLIDVETGDIQVYVPFENTFHHNPQFAPDGRSLYFIASPDGFSDIYRLQPQSGDLFRVTRLQTGVSGITALSPAMSIAAQSGKMMFSVFSGGDYSVYALEAEDAQGTPVSPGQLAGRALLPPALEADQGLVGNYLHDPIFGLGPPNQDYEIDDYRATLQLDYIAPPTVGVSVGGAFGTGISGGVGFYFSDMLGHHNLSAIVQANGRFKDVGGQVSYLNQKSRFNFGASVGHIPTLFSTAYTDVAEDPDSGAPLRRVNRVEQRIFVDRVDLIGALPVSTTRRFEVSAGFVRYGFDFELNHFTFFQNGILQDRENLPAPDPLFLLQSTAAYVTDYADFGLTSPVRGARSRLQVAPLFGSEMFVQALADVRRYAFLNPFSVAFRALHLGNYGARADDVFASEYLGYPNGLSFVRGYSFFSYDANECTGMSVGSCPTLNRLQGTRLAMASIELRVPLFGNERYGLVNFPYLPTELALFADGGVAWSDEEAPVLKFSTDSSERTPVFSAGVTSRFNLFNAVILEIFYAHPFQRPEKGSHFGIQLVPGW